LGTFDLKVLLFSPGLMVKGLQRDLTNVAAVFHID
jgi:hypothetical protein